MKIKDWIFACIGVMFALVAICTVAYISFDTSVDDETKMAMWIIIPIIAVIAHVIAMLKVKRGTLTVYRGWKDFGVSCTWPIAAILTAMSFVFISLAESSAGKNIGWIVAILLAVITVVSLVWMFFGAFSNNQGRLFDGSIALLARTTATLFFITYVSKLLETKDKFADGNASVQDYVKSVVGFIIFGIWFKMLVVPLVKDNREDAINSDES